LGEAPSDGNLYGRLNAAWVRGLPIAGGTLTGALVLSADPTIALHPATKQYVDNRIVRYDAAQSLTTGQTLQARQNITAAGLAVANAFTDTTDSTSPATGSIILAGGLGVAKKMQITDTITALNGITGPAAAVVAGGTFKSPGGGPIVSGTYNGASFNGVDMTSSSAAASSWGVMRNPNGIVGLITTNGTATSYGVSSDGRLKTNAVPYTESAYVIDNTDVMEFEWVADGSTSIGVIAQDASQVFPGAFTEGNGEPGDEDFVPWQADYSKYVAVLLAEVKALRARVAALEGG